MRARNIKPGFFKNDSLASLSLEARLLFIGLWCLADREGRLEDRPKRIKAEIFPYEDIEVEGLLEQLAQKVDEHPFIQRYQAEGRKCIQIVNFTKHQSPHPRESKSVLPPPPPTLELREESRRPEEDRVIPQEPVCEIGTPFEESHEKVVPSHEKVVPSHADSLILGFSDSLILRYSDSLILGFSDSLKAYSSPYGEALKRAFPFKAKISGEEKAKLGKLEVSPLRAISFSKLDPSSLRAPPPAASAEKEGRAPPDENAPPDLQSVDLEQASAQSDHESAVLEAIDAKKRGRAPPDCLSAHSDHESAYSEHLSMESVPPTIDAKKRGRAPPDCLSAHPAIEAYRSAFFLYPRRNLFPLIAEKVGEKESDLREWSLACESWAAHGWNPKNIAGLLEYFARRGFLHEAIPKREGIPKMSKNTMAALRLAEKYAREEEDEGRREKRKYETAGAPAGTEESSFFTLSGSTGQVLLLNFIERARRKEAPHEKE